MALVDGQLLSEIEQLRRTIRQAKAAEQYNTQGLADQAPRLERQLFELAEKAANEATNVVVQALPAAEFDDIVRRHPPSGEQMERWREQAKVFALTEMPEYNPETMAPELLAACLVEPEWSEDWWKNLSKGTQNLLWNLAHDVQLQRVDLPNSYAAIAMTSGGGEPSTMPANGASP